MYKKLLILSLVILLSACSSSQSDTYIPNEDFMQSLVETNNYMNDNELSITGDIYANVSIGAEYKESSLEVGIRNQAGVNEIYYNTDVSANTFISFIEDEVDNESLKNVLSIASGLTIYSSENSKEVLKDIDILENRIEFKQSTLEKFYNTNEEYLSYEQNYINFANNLSKYNIKYSKEKQLYVTTISVPAHDIQNLIPFTDINLGDPDYKYDIKFYQEEEDGLINAIEVVIIDVRKAGEKDIVYFNGKLSILFNLVPLTSTNVEVSTDE